MVKEPYAEILFQRFDLQPYRGLGEEKIFGALRKFRCSATTQTPSGESSPTAHPVIIRQKVGPSLKILTPRILAALWHRTHSPPVSVTVNGSTRSL